MGTTEHYSLLMVVVVVVGVAQGAEWFTSRGYHCINQCSQGEREGRQVYACTSVDGVHKGGDTIEGREQLVYLCML